MKELWIGQILLERYELLQFVAEGGMGQLFLIRDLKLNGVKRAMKLLKQQQEAAQKQWFEQEANILTKLNHKNLPIIFDYGYDPHLNRIFLVMEWIEGIDLAEFIHQQGGSLPLTYIIRYSIQLLEALHYLHNQQPAIIHRDLKPTNLMIGKNSEMKIIDFGISKQNYKQSDIITAHYGTRGYSSPEQLAGEETTIQSDLYSFGALLLVMFGIQPDSQLYHKDASIILRKKLSSIPKIWREVIIDCMQYYAKQRPKDALELLERISSEQLTENRERKLQLSDPIMTSNKHARFSILSVTSGAGATLCALSLVELLSEQKEAVAYIEHCYHFSSLLQQGINNKLVSTHNVKAEQTLGDFERIEHHQASYYVRNEISTISSINHYVAMQETMELSSILNVQQHAVVDYSSNWSTDEIELIVEHSDVIAIVSSPWMIKLSPNEANRLHALIKLCMESKKSIMWIYNREQRFAARAQWLQLHNDLPHIVIPEISTKLVLQDLWGTHTFPPYPRTIKKYKKYLMPLIKCFIYLH